MAEVVDYQYEAAVDRRSVIDQALVAGDVFRDVRARLDLVNRQLVALQLPPADVAELRRAEQLRHRVIAAAIAYAVSTAEARGRADAATAQAQLGPATPRELSNALAERRAEGLVAGYRAHLAVDAARVAGSGICETLPLAEDWTEQPGAHTPEAAERRREVIARRWAWLNGPDHGAWRYPLAELRPDVRAERDRITLWSLINDDLATMRAPTISLATLDADLVVMGVGFYRPPTPANVVDWEPDDAWQQ